MRIRSLLITIPVLVFAACAPQVASAPEPSCSAHLEIVPAGVHVWGESSIQRGTLVTIELWANGVLVRSYPTDVGYTGAVDAVIPANPVTYTVHWEGRVIHNGAVLCSAGYDG
jgi:hypothetical protein